MDEHPHDIRRRIEETKAGLNEKLETLENRYGDAVETVGKVVEGTLDAVQSVGEALDIPRHVRSRPWTMFAGSVAAGFVIGRLLEDVCDPRRGGAEPSWLSQQLGGLRDLALGGLVAVVHDLAQRHLPPVGRQWVDDRMGRRVAGSGRGEARGSVQEGNGNTGVGRADRLSRLH